MEVPSVCCVSHTSAVHEGLLSQCTSQTDLLTQGGRSANVGIACRIRKSHMKVYTLFQQNRNKKLMECRYFFSQCSYIIQENIS